MLARLLLLVTVVVSVAATAPVAGASDLIDRNATNVTLAVHEKGEALITYRAGGKIRRVLAWAAIDAIAPTRARPQVKFRLDYAGGRGKYNAPVWMDFVNSCGPYTGPKLQWAVAACTAQDGSHWALQSWQRMLPNFGVTPTGTQAAWELRLSHWTTAAGVLDITLNWAYRRYDHMFGTFKYMGLPVHGFRSTRAGVPLDTFGRNLYVDTYNSAYGPGWKRENSFLMHTGSGAFCYGFFAHGSRPAGNGAMYRATVIGPGVTPDVFWQSPARGPYNREADLAANALIPTLGSNQCRPN
jgi:hypothetical protein